MSSDVRFFPIFCGILMIFSHNDSENLAKNGLYAKNTLFWDRFCHQPLTHLETSGDISHCMTAIASAITSELAVL
jgi:hypothetical protein